MCRLWVSGGVVGGGGGDGGGGGRDGRGSNGVVAAVAVILVATAYTFIISTDFISGEEALPTRELGFAGSKLSS